MVVRSSWLRIMLAVALPVAGLLSDEPLANVIAGSRSTTSGGGARPGPAPHRS